MSQAQPQTVDSDHIEPLRVLWDGLIAGLLGALVVALAHLIADFAAGEPLRTPATLAVLLTEGPAAAANAPATAALALRFTLLHVAAWLILGGLASWLIALVDARPQLASLSFGGFAFLFITGLYASGALSVPGLSPLHLWVGTLLGSASAAAFLVWRHPQLAGHLQRAGLTGTTRRELERALEHETADLDAYHQIAERIPSPIFTKMIEEKRARSAMLRSRCEAMGLPPSEIVETAHTWNATTLEAALEEALACERNTIDFYDRFLAAVSEMQIRDLFLRLRYHVLDTTIPELERAIEVERSPES